MNILFAIILVVGIIIGYIITVILLIRFALGWKYIDKSNFDKVEKKIDKLLK